MITDTIVDNINEDLSDEEEVIIPFTKPKRIMSEKQLENLKKAREIAKIKLNQKKKETAENKKKIIELKLLQKLKKTQSIDMQLEDLKKKTIEPESEPESEVKKIYIKKPKPKKKIVYITESDSDSDDEKVIYKKKRKPIQKTVFEDLTIKDVEKKDDDVLLQQQYNDKLSLIKREFIMNQIFPK